MTNQSPAPVAGAVETMPDFDDPRVQAAYEVLCSPNEPPTGEHWEGFSARRIVAALAALHPQPAPAVAVEASEPIRKLLAEVLLLFHDFTDSIRCIDRVVDLEERIGDALTARSAPAVADGQWISVEDRLPDVSGIEDGETVLVANRGGSFAAEWHGTGITGFSSIHGDQFVEVTHWMQLPATPTTIAGMTASRDSQGQLTLGQECPRHRIHDCLACIRRPHGSGSAQEGQAK